MSVLSYSELARELGIAPRLISDFVYRGILNPSNWPKVAGRHVIPRDQVPHVIEILRARGLLARPTHARKGNQGSDASSIAEAHMES